MATYSNIGIKLITTGDESGTWGDTTNTNFSDILDQAIAGVITYNISSDADVTLTVSDGSSSDARNAVIRFTSTTLSATRTITFAPNTLKKTWLVINATTGGQSLTFKQGSSGATVTVPNGESAWIYSDGAGATNGAIFKALNSTTNAKLTTVDLNATTVDATNVEVTNIKAKDGTAAATIADSTGVVSLSANPTLSGGTANGVLYLNGSKVATSGTDLVFNATGLGIGTSSPSAKLSISGGNVFVDNANGSVIIRNADGTNQQQIRLRMASNDGVLDVTRASGTAPNLIFGTEGSEKMRLTDGGNLGIGTSSPGAKLDVSGGIRSSTWASNNVGINVNPLTGTSTNAQNLRFQTTGADFYLGTEGSTGGGFYPGSTAYAAVLYNANSTPIQFWTSGALQATLDSSGNLGIGTSSPAQKLHVASAGNNYIVSSNTAGSTSALLLGSESGQNTIYSWTTVAGSTGRPLAFYTGASESMRLDTSGNLGLGVTPSAWSPVYRAFNIGSRGFMYSRTDNQETAIGVNWYRDAGASFVYSANGYASLYLQTDGVHAWYNAANNTSGAGAALSLTQAMTLDASGNLGVGTTSIASGGAGTVNVNFHTPSANPVYFKLSNASTGNTASDGFDLIAGSDGSALLVNRENQPMIFYTNATERARITADGNLLVGTTSGGGERLRVDSGSTGIMAIFNSSNANGGYITLNSSGTVYADIGTAAQCFSGGSASNFALTSRGANALALGSNSTERARITAGGELCVGTTATTSGARLDVKGVDSTGSNYCVFFENSNSNLLLAVQNDGRWRSGTAAASPYNFVVGATNRDLFVDNAGEIGYVSSVRASKTNIAPVADTDWLLQLNPVTFNFRKKDTDGNYTDEADGPIKHGLIAEEVQAVNPDLCFYDDEGKGGALRGVNYSHLITPMLKLIQNQQAMINELKAKVAALEAK
jgi:hypothetical protein